MKDLSRENTTPRILLWGDSLTEGSPGVSFSSFLSDALPDVDWVVRGRGGDTALSLLRRLSREKVPARQRKAEMAVLWVGVNDVFADIVPGYSLIKAARRQRPTRNADDFERIYRRIIRKLRHHAASIIVLPPLFVGENPSTELNLRLLELGNRISSAADDFSECRFVDLRESLPISVDDAPVFLPVNPWSILAERFGQVEDRDYDKAAERRGLKWTYDGVHLNSTGARKVASVLAGVISKEFTSRMKAGERRN